MNYTWSGKSLSTALSSNHFYELAVTLLSPVTPNPNFSFMPFLFLYLHTQVHLLPKLHESTEATPPLSQPSHTILLPTPAPTKTRLSSQLSVDSNCQQQPHVSSSLHPLTSSDKLQREPHLPVTFCLLHFTSQAHTAQHKNSTVTQAVCRKYPTRAAKAPCSLFVPVAQQTHSK